MNTAVIAKFEFEESLPKEIQQIFFSVNVESKVKFYEQIILIFTNFGVEKRGQICVCVIQNVIFIFYF